MLPEDQFLLLPLDLREHVSEAAQMRLAAAQAEAGQLKDRLTFLEVEIENLKKFLNSHPGDSKVIRKLRNDIAHSQQQTIFVDPPYLPFRYDKTATQAAKILYVLRNPQKYPIEDPTFVGAGNVVKALKQEEPELRNESNSELIKKFGPTLSRMASTGEVKKFLENGTRSRVHYISPDWFIDDQIKPEYAHLLENLAPI